MTCTIKEQDIRQDFNNLEAKIMGQLLRPDGTPVPKHWAVFHLDELVEIKNHTFRVKYIGETSILFEPIAVLTIKS